MLAILRRFAVVALALAALLAPRLATAATGPDSSLRAVAARLIDEAQRSTDAYTGLSELCDGIGNRISGSPQLDAAIRWAADRMRAEGLKNVHTEKCMV